MRRAITLALLTVAPGQAAVPDRMREDVANNNSKHDGLGAQLSRDLAKALDIDAKALQALVRSLQDARGTTPPLPTRLLTSSGNMNTDSTRLAYMRMTNLLWDADVLPLPFVRNGPY